MLTKFHLIIFFLAILVLLFRFQNLYHKTSKDIIGQVVSFETVLTEQPKTSGNYQTFHVKGPNNEVFLIKTAVYPQFYYGQKVSISGTISQKSQIPVSKQNGRMLNQKQIDLTIYFPKIEASKNKKNNILETSLAVIESVRQKLIFFFESALSGQNSSLMLGIVFGIQAQMPKEFTNSLRTAGVIHVIAASGMNVAMVSEVLILIFGLIFKRQVAIILSLVGILFYTSLSGFQPSIVRASVMASIAFSAQILGRQTLAIINLLITAYVMLLISPDLVSDIGFQLSFASTLGLVVIPKLGFFDKFFFGEDVSTTIAAQLATLPILISNFGTYSIFSLLANALVLWTIPILMIIGAVSVLFGLLIQPIGHLILFLSLPFLWFFEVVVGFFGKIKPFELSEFPWQLTIGYYLILSSAVLFFQKRNAEN